ncbi:hypothetical protein MRX96_008174 [Rhipicephalus microplus]
MGTLAGNNEIAFTTLPPTGATRYTALYSACTYSTTWLTATENERKQSPHRGQPPTELSYIPCRRGRILRPAPKVLWRQLFFGQGTERRIFNLHTGGQLSTTCHGRRCSVRSRKFTPERCRRRCPHGEPTGAPTRDHRHL